MISKCFRKLNIMYAQISICFTDETEKFYKNPENS